MPFSNRDQETLKNKCLLLTGAGNYAAHLEPYSKAGGGGWGERERARERERVSTHRPGVWLLLGSRVGA